jgi:hypothetical protein
MACASSSTTGALRTLRRAPPMIASGLRYAALEVPTGDADHTAAAAGAAGLDETGHKGGVESHLSPLGSTRAAACGAAQHTAPMGK